MNTELLNSLIAATAANQFLYVHPSESGPLVAANYAQVNHQMPNPNGDGSFATRATPEAAAFIASLSAPQGQPAAPVTDFSAPVQGQPVPTQTTAQSGHGIGQQSAGKFVMGGGFKPAPKTAKPRAASTGENEVYPFSQLAAPVTNADGSVSYSFVFVPSNEYPKNDKQGRTGLRSPDDMAFSLQSACAAASRRFAKVLGTTQKTDKNGKVKNVNNYEYTRKFEVQGGVHEGQPGAFIYRAQ